MLAAARRLAFPGKRALLRGMAFDKARLRDQLDRLAESGVYLGTSSWKYPGWRGLLYDDARYAYRGKFAKSRFEASCLAEYAEVFKAVCVDAAYYTYPTVPFLRGLRAQVPDDFLFGFKITDAITIRKFPKHPRFREWGGHLNPHFLDAGEFEERFLRPCDAIRANVGILIFEFSRFYPSDFPDLPAFLAVLDPFLGALPKDWPYGIELRNRHWLTPDYFACLAKHGVAHVFNSWTDTPPVAEQLRMDGSIPNPGLVGARFLVTPGLGYEDSVSTFEPYDQTKVVDPLAREAGSTLIRLGRAAENRRTIVFANNRLEGNAVLTLQAMVEGAGG